MGRMVPQVNKMLLSVMFAFCLSVVFNRGMSKATNIDRDRALIAKLGGAARLAERLGYDTKKGGVQRVHNWKSRGIPSSVKVDHPEIFLSPVSDEASGRSAVSHK
ncbi:hypothetical protein ACTXHA_03980 [Burkholderia cenocepacia]